MFTQNIKSTKMNIHMSKDDYNALKDVIDPTIIDRASLMTAKDVWGVIPPGGDFSAYMVGESKEEVPQQLEVPKMTPRVTSFKANWHTADKKPAETAADANTFGASGTLELIDPPATIRIPVMDARSLSVEDLGSYGATLVPINTPVLGFNTSPYPLAAVTYSVDSTYTKEYLFKKEGGGGAFLERHVPPHVWVPMNPNSGGALILGQHDGSDGYKVLAVKIPYNYALALKESALHADSFLVGSYTMVLSATEDKGAKASTVILRKSNHDIQPVELVQVKSKADPFREIRFSASQISFFRRMQKEYIEEHRHEDPKLQRLHDQSVGLTVIKN
jgi:hypothetical protein